MRSAPTGAGRVAASGAALAASVLAACGALLARTDAPESHPEACQQLATAYHAIAKNKDLGSSKERQLMLVRQVAFENPSAPQSLAFMEHVVDVVYRYPDKDAEAIRELILADCDIDADGEPVLRTLWSEP